MESYYMQTIESLMKSPILSVSENTPIQEVIDGFSANKISSYLVKDKQGYVGIITKRDVIGKLLGKRDPKTTLVSEIMSRTIETLDAGTSIGKCCVFISDKGISHVVVKKGEDWVGIVSIKDLVPGEFLTKSSTHDDLLNRVWDYGNRLVEEEKES